jgi:glutathione S-transferase
LDHRRRRRRERDDGRGAKPWEALAELVRSQELELGVNFTSPDLEAGPPHPRALRRTFGSTAPIRVKLYRDHAAWCPYCQKVCGFFVV